MRYVIPALLVYGLLCVLNEVSDIPLVIALLLIFVLFLLVNKVADVVFDRWGHSLLGMLLFIGIGALSTGLYLATKHALTPTPPVLVP
jgi:hypothetical protein